MFHILKIVQWTTATMYTRTQIIIYAFQKTYRARAFIYGHIVLHERASSTSIRNTNMLIKYRSWENRNKYLNLNCLYAFQLNSFFVFGMREKKSDEKLSGKLIKINMWIMIFIQQFFRRILLKTDNTFSRPNYTIFFHFNTFFLKSRNAFGFYLSFG